MFLGKEHPSSEKLRQLQWENQWMKEMVETLELILNSKQVQKAMGIGSQSRLELGSAQTVPVWI